MLKGKAKKNYSLLVRNRYNYITIQYYIQTYGHTQTQTHFKITVV